MKIASFRHLLLLLAALTTASNSGAAIVWTSSTEFSTNYTVWQALPATCFTDATAGKLIRLKYENLQTGATAILYKGDWTAMPGYNDYVELTGNHIDIAITPAIQAELQKGGCIVFGGGFTMTSVHVISQNEVSQLQQSVDVEHDWLWSPPETPTIKVSITNPTATAATAHTQLIIRNDRMQPCTSVEKTVNVAAGQTTNVSIQIPQLEPGYYQCMALVNDELARTFNFGYAPESIASPPDMQSDFHTFWQQAKEQLAATPMDIKMTEIKEKSTRRRKVWLVEVRSAKDQTGEVFMRAYYAEPTGPGTYPALIHYLGYDTGKLPVYCMSGDDLPYYAEMYVSIRGQFINNRPPYSNPYGSNYFVYGFENKENYYYRGAYLDALRAVDFLCTREKVQKQSIFAEGSSQGGTLAIAAAALSDGRIRAIAPSLFSFSDFPHYLQLMAWPASDAIKLKTKLGWTEERMYKMLSYFDLKNLATMISCPVILNFSLQDNLCPPHCSSVFYNNLASQEKQAITNATLGHETPDNWWSQFINFFASYTSDCKGIESPITSGGQSQHYYSPDGRRFTHAPRRPGLYIRGGKKLILP